MLFGKKIKNIHFIGIGGVGMSGIAFVAKAQGLNVTGSDIRKSYMTDMLNQSGIKVYIGHTEDTIVNNDIDIVVVSTAILDNNPEYVAAKKKKIEIWHRAKMLAYLGRNSKTLACAGTHGKTSTSSMLASTMDVLGLDPSFLIGGVVRKYGTNAKSGSGEYYVVEADESDKSFKYIKPYSAIITNIEADHLDHYTDLNEIYEKFGDFIHSVDRDGFVVVCGDDIKLCEIAKKSHRRVITYGFDNNCDCRISNFNVCGVGCKFDVEMPVFEHSLSKRDNPVKIQCSLKQNPGRQYASNATSVLVLLDLLGYGANEISEALSQFSGVKRRFDMIGSVNDICVVDDYAHHSTEIKATVDAACALDFKNVHVVWQPHRYSRYKLLTEVYHDEFGHAFDGCSTVTFTNVYAAGETPIPGVNGETFLNVVREAGDDSLKTFYVENRADIVDHLVKIAQPGDLIITMGAGDISSKAPQILSKLNDIKSDADN